MPKGDKLDLLALRRRPVYSARAAPRRMRQRTLTEHRLDTAKKRAPRAVAGLSAILIAGCEPSLPPPPPFFSYEGLPVSGSIADARKAGFAQCEDFNIRLRCQRTGIRIAGQGPYSGGVDLLGGDGRGGFDGLTIWHPSDQSAVRAVGDALRRNGWQHCLTGEGAKGDQMVFTRPDAPVRFSMDISYWGKRRLRVLRETGTGKPACPTVVQGAGGRSG